MTPLTSKYKPFSMLLIFFFFLIAASFVLTHYSSSTGMDDRLQRTSYRRPRTSFTLHSSVLKDRVILVKGESVVTTNRCRLVFKGIEDDKIRLDLYLLELDPESAYVQNISKATAKEGFRMGNSEYQLISVNRKILKLKISRHYSTN